MSKQKYSSGVIDSQRGPEPAGGMAKPPEIVDLLEKVGNLLQDNQPDKALKLIARAKTNSPYAKNALAVCQLRLGNAKVAVDVYRSLVLAPGGIHMREDVPTVFKTNFAVALLKNGSMNGCLSTLAGIKEEDSAVAKLKAAIQRWKESLSLWEKINWYMGGQPDRQVVLDFPAGDLE
jgi:hypothetical protein